ncbi:MAG TPA: sulfite exporter TauE/SafE family protein [Actinomycetes bacterium]|nr:sulfite exporter TauE/SafE family protein [Actinomycetes bacterium]
MSLLESLAVVVAGLLAGMINAVVGSGTLITFPTLLALGVPPVTANVSNTVGLVPGSFSGAYGYRRELHGQSRRIARLGVGSALGGITGGLLLLVLPESAFEAIVPALILLGCALVILGPRISAATAHRRRGAHGGVALFAGIFGLGIYGGYFGAAQGILLVAVLSIALDDDLQRINALKNVLAGIVNLTAALLFIAVADVDWQIAVLIAIGAVAGGLLGARVGRRLPNSVLRGVIVIVGVTVSVWLILT